MRKEWRSSIVIFVFCSLFLHALSWVSLLLSPRQTPTQKENPIEIEIKDVAKNIEDPDQEKRQIVEQKEQLNEEKDEKAKFLSAFDQKVLKETQSSNHGQFQNQAAAGARQKPTPPPEVERPKEDSPEKSAEGDFKKKPTLSSLAPQFKPHPIAPEQTGDEGNNQEIAATDDYLKDVEVGMQTMLSTREFVYYSYYNRIKEKIRQHWEPEIRAKVKLIYRQGRSIASSKDHITQVVITLNNQGELVSVDVVTPSGLNQLDDAAIDAFRAAQPFPNPPKGLIDDDGLIKIRWDFVLEASQYRLQNDKNKFAKGNGDETDSTRGL